MWKRIVAVIVLCWVGYSVYGAYKTGLFSRPEMPVGAFSLSFKNGLRAIVVGIDDERQERRYFGVATEVPSYLEEAWSFCTPPTNAEAKEILTIRGNRPFERAEAVCRIEADEEEVVRGFITTVPKL